MSARSSYLSRAIDVTVAAGTLTAVAATAHTVANLGLLRTPPNDPPPVRERVSVLLPVRDEAPRVVACVRALLAQDGVGDLEILVLDDGSTDGTAALLEDLAASEPRLRLLEGTDPPAGWLGKPNACHRLAAAATGSVLVFVDADVLLAAHAVAAAVTLLRWSGLDLISPYPRQRADSAAERIVQPLLQWSWLTFLPLRAAETSDRASLAAANGQFLVVDQAAYDRAGGHASVRDAVLDDIALLRAVKTTGGHGGVVDGTDLATCHMYDGWNELRDGYEKSLWSAFGTAPGATATMAALTLAFVVPPLAVLTRRSRVGALGYAAGVTGRALVARRVGGRVWPDSLAHPVSISTLALLTARSWAGHRRGTLAWKGRTLP